MKLFSFFLMFNIVVFIAQSACQQCCSRYVVIAKPSEDQAEDDCNCDLTMSELLEYYNMSKTMDANCSRKDFLFQSGTHIINGEGMPIYESLTFTSPDIQLRSITIRGESNVIIKCMEEFYFLFSEAHTVVIKNIHMHNCNSPEYDGIYFSFVYCGYVKILDSKFTNCALGFKSGWGNCDIVIAIKSTIFENKSESQCCTSILNLYEGKTDYNGVRLPYLHIHIILQNLNVRNNNSSFLTLPYDFKENSFFHVALRGHNYFTRNNGAFIDTSSVRECKVNFSSSEVYVINNIVIASHCPYYCNGGSPVQFRSCEVLFQHSHVVFDNNSGYTSGGLLGYDTNIILAENTTLQFSNNEGQDGGAIYFQSSTFVFNATASRVLVTFRNNKAQRGGAIYYEDKSSSYGISNINLKSMFELHCEDIAVKVIFSNNSAIIDGDEIYGGWVDWFETEEDITSNNFVTIMKFLIFENCYSSESAVVSDPVRICLCIDSRPNCNITNHTMQIYGYSVSLDLVAVGQRFSPVQAYVAANVKGETKIQYPLQVWPSIENVQKTCTNITYKIYSAEETLLLTPKDMKLQEFSAPEIKSFSNDSATMQAVTLFQDLYVHLIFKPCPLGFILHKVDRNCICQPTLLSYGLGCDFDNNKILRKEYQWIGVTTQKHIIETDYALIVHQHCPFDYCRIDKDSLSFRLGNQYELCAFNRSGILCGSCETNFSRVLGSSKCKICSNNLILVAAVPIWLVVGLALVILLMMLDLTVSSGIINGLIFYTNIVHAQHAIFFTPDTSNSFLGKFIAWLNLDQGFETCLYNGLDDYVITWLGFLFPLYIWIIAAVLIVSSHYSTRISKLVGNNAVQVLATLFLITYTKLLQLIIGVFSSTTLVYPDGFNEVVWLVDGNIEFLSGRHIPLFIVTSLFVLLSLPFTVILLTIQWLLKISHYRVMFWVQNLKPFFDAYTGPYKVNHRYWTGFLLVVRIILLTSFSMNRSNNPTVNLLIIILFTLTLLVWLYFSGWVYDKWFNNCLEVFFLYNLCFISTITLFAYSNNFHYSALIYTSTGSTFAIFITIVLYQCQKQLFLTRTGAKLKKQILALFSKIHSVREIEEPCLHAIKPVIPGERSGQISCTVVELTEPLLEDSQRSLSEGEHEEIKTQL